MGAGRPELLQRRPRVRVACPRTVGITRRLATLEARLPPDRPPGPPLDIDRLTQLERDDLEAITTRAARDAAGMLDHEALSDGDLERREMLTTKAEAIP